MTLLLVILSVLALWVLLSLLFVGLLLILKTLETVRGHLEKITAGVRAIEYQTAPLQKRVNHMVVALDESGESLHRASERLAALAQSVRAAGSALRPGS